MGTALNPYLSFNGTTREAMEFYHSVFGGDLGLSTFGEFGTPGDAADLIMHANLTTPSGFTLMAADVPPGMPPASGSSISVSLSGDAADELRGYWDKLADGATITMPMERQAWGDDFGMLTDRYGTAWMVNIAGAAAS